MYFGFYISKVFFDKIFTMKNKVIGSVVIFCSLAFFFSFQTSSDSAALALGFAEVNYTPSVGLDMVGNYRGDDYASRGIHDSLYAKAIVAEGKGGKKTAIMAVDICFVDQEATEYLRAYVADNSDLKAEHILIHATHTHSGPKCQLDAPQAKNYLSEAADAIIRANQQLKPTRLLAGRTREDRVSHNRRLKAVDGTTHMVWETFEEGFIEEALGTIDPEMITISFEQEGEVTGSLINFGCHPTTLTGNNWLFSADYPGYIAESVKKVKGENFGSMFLNGACGNVTQVDHVAGFIDTYQECQRIGYILGIAALEAINKSVPLKDDNTVNISSERVPLKKMTITDQQFAWAEEVMERVAREGMPPLQPDGIPNEVYAEKWVEMYQVQDEYDSLEVQVIQIGEFALVGLPGEMFNEFGVYIKENSPFQNTMVVGLANAAAGYFPTEISFTQGPAGFKPMITGYETTPGTTYYDIGAGELLAESAVRQLKQLFELKI